MFCVEVRNQCRLSTRLVRSFLYLDTDFVDILFRALNAPFFTDVLFSRILKAT